MNPQSPAPLLALSPCPGCGGTRTRVIGGPGTKGGPQYWAGCDICRWRTWGHTEYDAITAWNTREPDPAYWQLQHSTLLTAYNELLAEKGECVVFRFRDTRFKDKWSRWLPIDELNHYADGSLVDGPHPNWEVQRAYTPNPGSEVRS